jgi:hypothetical protein
MAEAPGCIPNIGTQGIRQRRLTGWTSLIMAVGLGALLLILDAPRESRLLVALPLIAAGLGFFQASEKT